MKMRIAIPCLIILLICAAGPAMAVPIDVSSGGVEVTAPDEIIFHNVRTGSGYYYGVFKWHPAHHIWYLTDYGPEDSTFSAEEYYPFEVGRSWTYALSTGGTYTLTITGTEEVCGQTCFRQDASDGGVSYWINDETGVWVTRMVNPDGSYTDFCPPMKMAPPQLYLGMQSLHAFYDAPYFMPPGIQVGTLDGWSSFVAKGLEDVTVPAGTFLDCSRNTFVFSYTSSNGTYAVRTEETWHAQGVGIVRRVKTEAYGFGGTIGQSSIQCYDLQSYTTP